MNSSTTNQARRLRKPQSDAEQKLWMRLRGRRLAGTQFRRQEPIGPFIADFCCVERKLIVEVDGSQHASHADQDDTRTAFLATRGYRVLRFWDHEVLHDIEAVLERIDEAIRSPHPNPLPEGEGSANGENPKQQIADSIDVCSLHDQALAEWYGGMARDSDGGTDLASLVQAQHYCNFTLWNLEDEARRVDVEDTVIASTKHSIDSWNQRRNDLIEQIDEALLAQLPTATPGAEQHSETAGQMIDRLSILALKIYHMGQHAERRDDPALAAECAAKLGVLTTQRHDLAGCLRRLLEECRAGRRLFKIYRQFKSYNDPRLNPALAPRR